MPCKSTDVFDCEYIRFFSGSVLDVCIVHWTKVLDHCGSPWTKYLFLQRLQSRRNDAVRLQILKNWKEQPKRPSPARTSFRLVRKRNRKEFLASHLKITWPAYPNTTIGFTATTATHNLLEAAITIIIIWILVLYYIAILISIRQSRNNALHPMYRMERGRDRRFVCLKLPVLDWSSGHSFKSASTIDFFQQRYMLGCGG